MEWKYIKLLRTKKFTLIIRNHKSPYIMLDRSSSIYRGLGEIGIGAFGIYLIIIWGL